jgi:ABC-2 type transport system ATP-binding protein
MHPALDICALRKTYRATKKSPAKEALKGIDLQIRPGAFFGLLGPNGAGKSTLINIIAGLVTKTSGEVRVCGHDIEREMRAARCSVGVVPQELIVDTFFTAREALDIHAGYYGVPKAQRRTDEILEALGLTDKADTPSRRLSGGMRRRLLVGKALVHSPRVLILDEPTAGVDVELRTQLWNYVRGLNAQGTTVLLTTHYLEEAEQLCDEIAIINHGEVIVREPKKQLMQRFNDKRLVVQAMASLTEVPPALASLSPELDQEGRLVIRYLPTEQRIQALLKQVEDAGITIQDIATQEPSLEDVFRKLVAA